MFHLPTYLSTLHPFIHPSMLAHPLPRDGAVKSPPIGSQPRSTTSPLPSQGASYCWLSGLSGRLSKWCYGKLWGSSSPPHVPTAAGVGVISYLGFTKSHKLDLLMLISAARADQQQGGLRDPMPYGCVLLQA